MKYGRYILGLEVVSTGSVFHFGTGCLLCGVPMWTVYRN